MRCHYFFWLSPLKRTRTKSSFLFLFIKHLKTKRCILKFENTLAILTHQTVYTYQWCIAKLSFAAVLSDKHLYSSSFSIQYDLPLRTAAHSFRFVGKIISSSEAYWNRRYIFWSQLNHEHFHQFISWLCYVIEIMVRLNIVQCSMFMYETDSVMRVDVCFWSIKQRI